MVRVTLVLPDTLTATVDVDFLIDTGATITAVHPRDAVLRLGIDPVRLASPHRWATTETVRRMGDTAAQYRVRAEYRFLDDELGPQMIRGEVRIAQLRAGTETLPSLLGWDILQDFELVMNWPDRVVTLRPLGVPGA